MGEWARAARGDGHGGGIGGGNGGGGGGEGEEVYRGRRGSGERKREKIMLRRGKALFRRTRICGVNSVRFGSVRARRSLDGRQIDQFLDHTVVGLVDHSTASANILLVANTTL